MLPHPSSNDPMNPVGQVAGWQHEPSLKHSDPVGHFTQVTCGKPHPGLIGLHDLTLVHDVGVQHLLSTHGSPAPHVVPHWKVAPPQGSTHVPQ